MKKKTSLFKIIFIVIVIFFIASFLKNIFTSKSEEKEDSNLTNSYIENHTVAHNVNTSSDDVNYDVSNGARDKFTKILGNNKDEVTLMVYIIGTDLESGYGAATTDINEMLYAKKNDNINIVLQTGGCRRWQNNVISSNNIERYTINQEGLLSLNTKIKNGPMTDSDALSDFIKYSADNFPANRYMLVLWDHGGGSLTGYGYDEKYPNAPSLSPDLIGKALKDSGIKFDFVGFDACLMANLETALAIEPYADYMIGSEESEPGGGWFYTNFIEDLDANTSISTVDLAKTIVDDFIDNSLKDDRRAEVTQSLIDLGELVYNIKEPLTKFSKATNGKINSDSYEDIGNARCNTKEFAKDSGLDQVDLIDLVERFNVDGSDELVKGLEKAIKYNKTANINDAYGLSAYFPLSSLGMVNDMVKIYDNINIDKEYSDVVKSFASVAASGQIVSHNQNDSAYSIFDILSNNSYYDEPDYSSGSIYDILNDAYNYDDSYYGYDDVFGSGYNDWYGYDYLDPMSIFFSRSKLLDTTKLKVSESDGRKVVALDNETWSKIQDVTLNMFIDDGEGYIELGKDNTFDWNTKGELIVEADGTWLAINDNIIPYFLVEDTYIDENNYKVVGRVPCYLNNEKAELIINFTNENPYGIVLGAKKIYESSTQAKGYIKINIGDEIKFVTNYYDYDGNFIDEYQIGEALIVDKELELNNIYLDNDYMYTYCFKDYYGNDMYLPIMK